MRASRFRRRLVSAMLAVYVAFVCFITLTPQMPGTGFIDKLVRRFLRELEERGITRIDYNDFEFFGNILMFVPLGVFVALLIPRKAWWTLLFMGTAFSGLIELSQATFFTDRYPDVRDVVSNTTGFLIGAAASITLRLIVSHRDSLVELDRRTAAQRP